jgi:hypothetical protein
MAQRLEHRSQIARFVIDDSNHFTITQNAISLNHKYAVIHDAAAIATAHFGRRMIGERITSAMLITNPISAQITIMEKWSS